MLNVSLQIANKLGSLKNRYLHPTLHHVPENNRPNCCLLTFRTRDNRTTLIRLLLNCAVLSDALSEGTHSQVAHQHPVVAGAVEARLIGDDAITLLVMLVVVIATFHICGKSK
jgi:hypothetical protein